MWRRTSILRPTRNSWQPSGLASDWLHWGETQLQISVAFVVTAPCRRRAALADGATPPGWRQAWQSLWSARLSSTSSAPPPDEVLAECIHFFSGYRDTDLPPSTAGRLDRLLAYFRQARCLLILDKLEAIMQPGRSAGLFCPPLAF